jgi:hypothetical protein
VLFGALCVDVNPNILPSVQRMRRSRWGDMRSRLRTTVPHTSLIPCASLAREDAKTRRHDNIPTPFALSLSKGWLVSNRRKEERPSGKQASHFAPSSLWLRVLARTRISFPRRKRCGGVSSKAGQQRRVRCDNAAGGDWGFGWGEGMVSLGSLLGN